jgi:hypothetical protein
MRPWPGHLFSRSQLLERTWTPRLFLVVAVVVTAIFTRGLWVAHIGRMLVCVADPIPSELIVLENLDPNYLVFERAAALQRAGLATRALIPVQRSPDRGRANPVSEGIAELMARQARLTAWRVIPIAESEPISLNAASQIRNHLAHEGITSVIVVAPGFRSQRSYLVYRAMLDDLGIRVSCSPVFGSTAPDSWSSTWHGIQEVTEQFLKLQYYRVYVLPFVSPGPRPGPGQG